jgi:hypothetical protein
MITKLAPILALTAAILVLSLALGCGSDNGSPGPTTKTVNGIVMKGPVEAASIEVYSIKDNGYPDELVAGPATTASDGTWTLEVPTSKGDDLLVFTQGGSYTDEVTGGLVAFGAKDRLVSRLDMRSDAPFVVVSPFTHTLYGAARARIAAGTSIQTAWDDVTAEMVLTIGFDAVQMVPAARSGTTDGQRRYLAFLGGISTLVHDNPQLAAILNESGAGQIVTLLADDLSDGLLDAKNAQGSAIQRTTFGGETKDFPPIDTEGAKPLAAATATYAEAAVPELDPSRIPQDPDLFPGGGGCGNLELLRGRAYASLEDGLYAPINGPDLERPSDVNLTEPRNLYAQILTCEPDDPEANLALAILDLAVLLTDDEVNAAFDEWNDYLEDYLPFEHGASKGISRFTPKLATGGGALALPLAVIQRNLFLSSLAQDAGVPQISRTQDILENKVLPLLDSGIDHLDKVLAAPDFEFVISPRMEGDEYEDPITTDRTDFLALRAALHGVKAGCYAAMAYNADLPAYDGAHLLAGLNRDSGSLGRLRGGGRGYMQAIPSEMVAAADDLDAAITSLLNEPGGSAQTYDLIKIGPDGLDRADLEDFQTNDLPDIRAVFLGPVTWTEDWDENSYTPDAPLTIDLAAFFGNPIQDWKQKAPPYSVSLDAIPFDEEYIYGTYWSNLTVVAPSSGEFSANCYGSYSNYVLDRSYCTGPAWLSDAIQNLFDQKVADILANPEWTGELTVAMYYNGSFVEGTNSIYVTVYEDYWTADQTVDIPLLTFSADIYTDWVDAFPDPTLNGLFPDIQNVDELAQLFGISTNGWEKVMRVDWVNGDLEFEHPIAKGPRPGGP